MKKLKQVTMTLKSEINGAFGAFPKLTVLPLLAAVLITLNLVSCAGREGQEPETGAGSATSGTSAAASEVNTSKAGTQDSAASQGQQSVKIIESATPDDKTWVLITDVNAERKFDVYVDTSTIQTIDDDVYSWSKLIFKEDQKDTDGLVYKEVLISSAINCKKNTYEYKSSKFYDSLGRMVYMENIASNRSVIPVKSVSRHVADFVCGYDAKAAKKAVTPPVKSK